MDIILNLCNSINAMKFVKIYLVASKKKKSSTQKLRFYTRTKQVRMVRKIGQSTKNWAEKKLIRTCNKAGRGCLFDSLLPFPSPACLEKTPELTALRAKNKNSRLSFHPPHFVSFFKSSFLHAIRYFFFILTVFCLIFHCSVLTYIIQSFI